MIILDSEYKIVVGAQIDPDFKKSIERQIVSQLKHNGVDIDFDLKLNRNDNWAVLKNEADEVEKYFFSIGENVLDSWNYVIDSITKKIEQIPRDKSMTNLTTDLLQLGQSGTFVAKQAAKGGNPWRNFVGQIELLKDELSKPLGEEFTTAIMRGTLGDEWFEKIFPDAPKIQRKAREVAKTIQTEVSEAVEDASKSVGGAIPQSSALSDVVGGMADAVKSDLAKTAKAVDSGGTKVAKEYEEFISRLESFKNQYIARASVIADSSGEIDVNAIYDEFNSPKGAMAGYRAIVADTLGMSKSFSKYPQEVQSVVESYKEEMKDAASQMLKGLDLNRDPKFGEFWQSCLEQFRGAAQTVFDTDEIERTEYIMNEFLEDSFKSTFKSKFPRVPYSGLMDSVRTSIHDVFTARQNELYNLVNDYDEDIYRLIYDTIGHIEGVPDSIVINWRDKEGIIRELQSNFEARREAILKQHFSPQVDGEFEQLINMLNHESSYYNDDGVEEAVRSQIGKLHANLDRIGAYVSHEIVSAAEWIDGARDESQLKTAFETYKSGQPSITDLSMEYGFTEEDIKGYLAEIDNGIRQAYENRVKQIRRASGEVVSESDTGAKKVAEKESANPETEIAEPKAEKKTRGKKSKSESEQPSDGTQESGQTAETPKKKRKSKKSEDEASAQQPQTEPQKEETEKKPKKKKSAEKTETQKEETAPVGEEKPKTEKKSRKTKVSKNEAESPDQLSIADLLNAENAQAAADAQKEAQETISEAAKVAEDSAKAQETAAQASESAADQNSRSAEKNRETAKTNVEAASESKDAAESTLTGSNAEQKSAELSQIAAESKKKAAESAESAAAASTSAAAEEQKASDTLGSAAQAAQESAEKTEKATKKKKSSSKKSKEAAKETADAAKSEQDAADSAKGAADEQKKSADQMADAATKKTKAAKKHKESAEAEQDAAEAASKAADTQAASQKTMESSTDSIAKAADAQADASKKALESAESQIETAEQAGKAADANRDNAEAARKAAETESKAAKQEQDAAKDSEKAASTEGKAAEAKSESAKSRKSAADKKADAAEAEKKAAQTQSDAAKQESASADAARESAGAQADAAEKAGKAVEQDAKNADQTLENAEKKRKAAEINDKIMDALLGGLPPEDEEISAEERLRNASELVSDSEYKSIMDAIQKEIGEDSKISSVQLRRALNEDGTALDAVQASIKYTNEALGETWNRIYVITKVAGEMGEEFTQISLAAETLVQRFSDIKMSPDLLRENAEGRISKAIAGLSPQILNDSDVISKREALEAAASSITNRTDQKNFDIMLDTFRNKIQELQRQTGGDKFNPLLSLEKTIGEIPASFARVSSSYEQILSKNDLVVASGKTLKELYDETADSIALMQLALEDDSGTSIDDKVKLINDARKNIDLLRKETAAAKSSVEELFAQLQRRIDSDSWSAQNPDLALQSYKIQSDLESRANSASNTSIKVSGDAIREEIAAYEKMYEEQVRARDQAIRAIERGITSTSDKTRKANGYFTGDAEEVGYAQKLLSAKNAQLQTETKIAEARQQGLITEQEAYQYTQALTVSAGTRDADVSPVLKNFDSLLKKSQKLSASLADIGNQSGNRNAQTFADSLQSDLDSLLVSVGAAKTAMENDPTRETAEEYYRAAESLRAYSDTLSGVTQNYPKFLKIQSQFNAELLEDSAKTLMSNVGEHTGADSAYQSYLASVQNMKEGIDKVLSFDFESGNVDDFKTRLQSVVNLYAEMNTSGKALRETVRNVFARTESMNEYKALLEDIQNYYTRFGEGIRTTTGLNDEIMSFIAKLQNPFENFSSVEEAKKAFEDLRSRIQSCGAETESYRVRLQNLFNTMLGAVSIRDVFQYMSQILKTFYQNVVDIDTSLVELRKVTDATDYSMDQFLENASDRAKELGVTITDLIDATSSFARMGYGMEESTALGESATMLKNVGDEIESIDDATSIIISTMKAFGMAADDVSSIVDKLNEVSNNYAITSGGLGAALTKSASAAYSAGNTLDQTLAILTTANQVVQNPESVGTMLRTLTLRIRGAKTELEEASLDTDGMANSVSTLRDKILGLTNVHGTGGFDILTDSGEFKSTYDILVGIGKVWDEIGDVDQAALLQMVAGKHNSNAVSAILDNYQDMEDILETSTKAAGSASKEYENWLDSIEARINKLKASVSALSTTVVDSDLVKGGLDFINGMVSGIDTIIGKLNVLGTDQGINSLAGIIGAVASIKDLGFVGVTRDQNGLATGLNLENFKSIFNIGKSMEQSKVLIDDAAASMVNLLGTCHDLSDFQTNLNQNSGFLNINVDSSQLGGVQDLIANLFSAQNNGNIANQKQLIEDWAKSQKSAAAASTALGAASKAASVGMKILSGVCNSLISMAISVGIQLIVQGLDALVHQTENNIAKTQELKEKADSLTESLTSVTAELTTMRDRMRELETIENPTLTDEADLANLREEVTLLEAKQKILEHQENAARQEAEEQAVRTLESAHITSTNLAASETSGYFESIDTSGYGVEMDVFELLDFELKKRKIIQDNLKRINTEIAALDENDADYDNLVSEKYNLESLEAFNTEAIEEYMGTLESVQEGLYGVTETGKKYSSLIDDAILAVADSLKTDEELKLDSFNEIWGNADSDLTKNLSDMARQGTLTSNTLKGLGIASRNLTAEMAAAGISADDFVNHLYSLYSAAGDGTGEIASDIVDESSFKESLSAYGESIDSYISALESVVRDGLKSDSVLSLASENNTFSAMVDAAKGDSQALIESMVGYIFETRQKTLDSLYEQQSAYIKEDKSVPTWLSGMISSYEANQETLIKEVMTALSGDSNLFGETVETSIANVRSAIGDAVLNGIQGKYDIGTFTFDSSAYDSLLTQFPEIEQYLTRIQEGTISWKDALVSVGNTRVDGWVSVLNQAMKTIPESQKDALQSTIDDIQSSVQTGLLNTHEFASGVFSLFTEDLNTLSEAWSSWASEDLTAEGVQSLLDQFPELVQYVDATDEKFTRLGSAMKSLSETKCREYLELIRSALTNAPDDMRNELLQVYNLMNQMVSSAWDITSVSHTFDEVTSQINIMKSALEEQTEEGSITAETMRSMKDAGLDLLYTYDDTTKSVTVSKAAFQNYTAALVQANIAELEAKKRDLTEKFNSQTAAINAATAALVRYNVALSGASSGGLTTSMTKTRATALRNDQTLMTKDGSDSKLSKLQTALNRKNLNSSLNKIDSEIDTWNKLLSEINTGVSFGGSTSGSSGGSGSSSDSSSDWKADIDDLWAYKQAIEAVQNSIDLLDSQKSIISDSDYDALRDNITDSISLYNQLQASQQGQLAESTRLIRQNIAELQKYGFEVEYTAESNTLLFKNYDKLNSYTGELGETINDLIEETQDLNDSNKSLSQSYYSNIQKIQSYKEELLDLIDAEAEASQSRLDLSTKISEVYMKCYKEGTEKYQEELGKQQNYLRESLELRRTQLEKYAKAGVPEDDDRVLSALTSYWEIQGNLIDMNISAWEKSVDAQREAHEAQQQALSDQQDALNDIIDLTVDLIKKEKNDQIDAINDQIDKYEEIVEAKKKTLNLTQETLSYERELGKKTKNVSDLQNRIQKLSLDDSREAYAERIALEEELAEAQEELAEYQSDKSYELREDALDEELSSYKATRQLEINSLQEYLNQSGTLIQDAMNRIAQGGNNLYSELISYNAVYGDGVGTDLVSAWEKATAAIQAYGSIQAALTASIPDFVEPEMPDFSTGIVGIDYASMLSQYSSGQQTENDIINQMKANSAAWHGASDAERKRLHEENKRLAAKLGLQYDRDYNTHTGKWYRNGYPLYHKGLDAGYVGFPSLSLQDRERLAILKDRELVLNDSDISSLVARLQQIPNLFHSLANGSSGVGNSVVSVSVDAPFTFNGSDEGDLRRAFEDYQSTFAQRVQNLFDNIFTGRGYTARASLSALKV